MLKKMKLGRMLVLLNLWLIYAGNLWAATSSIEEPIKASEDFSQKVLDIIQGPLLKLLAAIVLLVGIAGLLRGRHRLAISCGMAFILILFLPVLLQNFK